MIIFKSKCIIECLYFIIWPLWTPKIHSEKIRAEKNRCDFKNLLITLFLTCVGIYRLNSCQLVTMKGCFVRKSYFFSNEKALNYLINVPFLINVGRISVEYHLTKGMVFCYQNCSDLLWERIILVTEKNFEIRGWRPRIFKNFEITRAICSNSDRSEQFLVTECFLNLFLEVSQI